MAFSYDPEALSVPLNHVRFLIQDTFDEGHFFDDAEITFALSLESNLYRIAADFCRAAAAKFIRLPGYEDKVILRNEEKAKTYLQLAANFDDKAIEFEESLTNPASAGLSLPVVSDRDPTFTRDLHFSDRPKSTIKGSF